MKPGENSQNETYMVQDPLGNGLIKVLKSSNAFGSTKPPRRGKIRDVYDLGEEMIILTTDRISAFDVVYPTLIPHKGESLHALSVYWFERTNRVFPNHFKETLDSRSMKVIKAQRIDVEWVCRAYLYGSAWRAYRDGIRTILAFPTSYVKQHKGKELYLTFYKCLSDKKSINKEFLKNYIYNKLVSQREKLECSKLKNISLNEIKTSIDNAVSNDSMFNYFNSGKRSLRYYFLRTLKKDNVIKSLIGSYIKNPLKDIN